MPDDGLFDLNSFQRDLLFVAAGKDQPSGQEIKQEIERKYNEVTHGRLYPNLDTLAEEGYVEKGEINRRTNSYSVTEQGIEVLESHREWQKEHLDGATDPISR